MIYIPYIYIAIQIPNNSCNMLYILRYRYNICVVKRNTELMDTHSISTCIKTKQ